MDSLRAREEQFERHYREEVLATTRLALSLSALVAIYIDPTEPAGFATVAYGLLGCYVAYSAGLMVWLRAARDTSTSFVAGVHAVDIVWAATISLFTSGPSSAFFVFFVFVILTAAFRWQMADTMWTTAVLIVVLLIQGALLQPGPSERSVFGVYEINRLIIRSVYLLIVGFFSGYLSGKAKRSGEHAIVISELLSDLRSELKFRQALDLVLTRLVAVLGASRGVVVFHDFTTDRVSLVDTAEPEDGEAVAWRELTPGEAVAFFFPLPGMVTRIPVGKTRVSPLVLNDAGRRVPRPAVPALVPGFLDVDDCVVIAADLFNADEWRARIFMVHRRGERATSDAARLLYRVVQSVGPVVHNVFLIGRLRAQASATERSRVAREIHDSSLQGLAAIELQMKALEQQVQADSEMRSEVARIRALVHEEALDLRDLMHRTRPIDVRPAELADAIADMTERFERETGTTVRLEVNVDSIALKPDACRHLVRIVQEALTNVRKHAAARAVDVVMEQDADGALVLVVRDDGKGLAFDGEMTLEMLDNAKVGPRVIAERARLMGARLTVRSKPGHGCELRVTAPAAQGVTHV